MIESLLVLTGFMAMIALVSYYMGKTAGQAQSEKQYNYTRMQQARRLLHAERNTTHPTDKETGR